MSVEPRSVSSGAIDIAPDPARVEEGFERRVSKLTEAARRVRSGTDPDAIHDLRVATRRVVAALGVWRQRVTPSARREACRALTKLRRRLGRARELEVHVALAEARRPERGAPGRAAVDSILERLRERLARRRRAARKRVSPRRLKRLRGRLDAAASGLTARDHAADDLRTIERRIAGRATDALRHAAGEPGDGPLHDARIRVKQWRYALECLEEAAPGGPWHARRTLRRFQTLLGDIHDRALLRDLLAGHAPEPLPEPERAALAALIETLDAERERAVRRFQRRVAAGIDVIAAPELVPVADAPAPDTEPATGHAARDGRSGPLDPRRDERWSRIATWLERTGGGE